MNLLAPLSWPWPLPALLVWVLAWVTMVALRGVGLSLMSAWVVATLLGVFGSVWGRTPVRRLLMALGFPLSWWVLTAGTGSALSGLPAWVWLLPLAAVCLLYPPGTWRDAPLFPTPRGAMDGLAEQVSLPLAGHVLDAGCGLGDGLQAMERAWPEVHLHGLERSWPLRLMCALRCPTARVRQGDMWREDWARYDLVYLFQRPESMARAWAKAQQDLAPGAWLASLEFAVTDVTPTVEWRCPDGRPLWLYRMPAR